MAQKVRNPPAMWETQVWSLRKIPWIRERLPTPYAGLENSGLDYTVHGVAKSWAWLSMTERLWLVPSAVILEPKKKSLSLFAFFPPSICHEVMGLDAMIFAFWMLSFKPAFHSPLSLSSRGSSVPLQFLSFVLISHAGKIMLKLGFNSMWTKNF